MQTTKTTEQLMYEHEERILDYGDLLNEIGEHYREDTLGDSYFAAFRYSEELLDFMWDNEINAPDEAHDELLDLLDYMFADLHEYERETGRVSRLQIKHDDEHDALAG